MEFILGVPRDPRHLQLFFFFPMHGRRVSNTTAAGDIFSLVVASGMFCRDMSYFVLSIVAFQVLSATFVFLALHTYVRRVSSTVIDIDFFGFRVLDFFSSDISWFM